MKEERKHSIDKLFHDSLNGQLIEPGKDVWVSLSTQVPSGNGSEILMFLFSAIIIGAFSLFLNTQLITDNGLSDVPVNIETNNLAEPSAALTENEQDASKQDQPIEPLPEISDIGEDIEPISSTSEQIAEKTPPPVQKPVEYNIPASSKASSEENQISNDKSYVEYDKLDLLDYRMALIELDDPIELNIGESRETGDPIFDLTIKDTYVKKADVLFGAAFSPAVNNYPDGQNRNDYSVEIIAAYEKSRFILEGGIGGNYTTESVKYGINYSTYDSVGYYVNVSSFNTALGNPDSVFFETSLKSIYDSIDRYRIQENTNKYSYFQIPLRIGYRVIEKNRFSLDLKVGVLFSLQVYKDVPNVPYQGNDADQIEVIMQYPDRLKTNWQYTASVGMNYQINRQLRFTLEPFYRQYLKSVYSTSSEYSARSPYAFGIRFGIYYHF